MYKHILIATDGSELSQKAVEHGLSLAALTGATVTALKVVPHYPRSYFEGGLPTDAGDIIRAKGEARGVTVQSIVTKSDLIAEAVISAAKEHQCDLIVMASHGRKGLTRLLLGSETQHVLTHSHIPVLVLR